MNNNQYYFLKMKRNKMEKKEHIHPSCCSLLRSDSRNENKHE